MHGFAYWIRLQKFSHLLQNGGSQVCSGEMPGHALGEEQSHGQARENFLKCLSILHARSRICLQRPGKEKKARLFSFCTFFWSVCYCRSNKMQDWGSTDRRFPHSRSLPAPLSELLPEMQGKTMLQQVGSIFLAILYCLSSSLTSIFQWGNNKAFPSTKQWKRSQIGEVMLLLPKCMWNKVLPFFLFISKSHSH